ncbi:hypothetical protein [Flavobacterium sp. B17]|uniref:hypothetical protein n=1 Tax=Flavobacterium sp. B17 TaxID=95618 RepID=UPI0003481C4E|nr:hypothetical protein [Flavobacterium sp. B17]
MKNLVLCLIFILSCKKNDDKINTIKNVQQNFATDTIKIDKVNDKVLRELLLPYCFKVDMLPKSNYYQTNLDTFLTHHNLERNNSLNENKKFHKYTVDFVSDKQANFMHYPYDGKAYALKKLTINSEITAILYAYTFDSEMIQPRIEIQTFDNKQNNIDNLIIASTFSSECSGYRDFCISQDKIITINNYYYCSDIDTKYENKYKYKINDVGQFVYEN